jgi:predicted lysophospholipase L1 biosynthesis ABC-type transport system permease subunit
VGHAVGLGARRLQNACLLRPETRDPGGFDEMRLAAALLIPASQAPGTPIRSIKTMEEQADESLSTERLTAYLSVFFAALALLLTAVGLCGILAYAVSRRTSEIGIRMALGAQRASVVWLVIREAMRNAVVGAAAGIAVVAASSKLIVSLLYGVRANDPATMLLAERCGCVHRTPRRGLLFGKRRRQGSQ